MIAPEPQQATTPRPAPLPQVLLLILGEEDEFDDKYATLVSEINTRYTTIRKTTTDDGYNYLLTNEPSAIFVDGGIIRKQNQHLQRVLARYINCGGTMILSSLVYSTTTNLQPLLQSLFRTFTLYWNVTGVHSAIYKLNDVVGPTFGSQAMATLKKRYRLKCIYLRDTPIFSRVYTPAARPPISDLFSPYELEESPAVFARYGLGFFGFIGDVRNETGSQALTLAMLGKGLFPSPRPFHSIPHHLGTDNLTT